jgi:hypothetical protein
MLRHERIIRIRCAPKRAPCPTCGRRGHRKRVLHRRLRTLAYYRLAWLEIIYAEYQARCASCCHSFPLRRVSGPLRLLPLLPLPTQGRLLLIQLLLARDLFD